MKVWKNNNRILIFVFELRHNNEKLTTKALRTLIYTKEWFGDLVILQFGDLFNSVLLIAKEASHLICILFLMRFLAIARNDKSKLKTNYLSCCANESLTLTKNKVKMNKTTKAIRTLSYTKNWSGDLEI